MDGFFWGVLPSFVVPPTSYFRKLASFALASILPTIHLFVVIHQTSLFDFDILQQLLLYFSSSFFLIFLVTVTVCDSNSYVFILFCCIFAWYNLTLLVHFYCWHWLHGFVSLSVPFLHTTWRCKCASCYHTFTCCSVLYFLDLVIDISFFPLQSTAAVTAITSLNWFYTSSTFAYMVL